METQADLLALVSEFGMGGALVALMAWFGKRFLALHDRLLEQLEKVIEESLAARQAMDAARQVFTKVGKEG
ncbi:MAG: hypothetical protein KDB07_12850 [Planctomycetes bacterium]|nr:hypothetical protein [Planctomycetota bacterium]